MGLFLVLIAILLLWGGKALNFCHIEKNRFIIIHTMVNSEW